MPNPQNLEGKGFKPGQSGNPAGRPKGIKNWSVIVQNLLGDEELFEKVIASDKNKPAWLDQLKNKNAASAIVVAMQIRAVGGDNRAADWLRKTGFGDKLDISSLGEKITVATVEFIKPPDGNSKDTDKDSSWVWAAF